jgi:FkbM family methyltransferase
MSFKKNISFKYEVFKLHLKRLGFFNLLSYVLQRIFIPANQVIKISIPGLPHPVFVRNVPSDTQIFTQIFLREELKISLDILPTIIIDGGANIGMATLYLKNRYPNAAIFSVEPDVSNFDLLVKNTSKYKNIICYNNGIWNKRTNLHITNQLAGNESFIVSEIADAKAGDSIVIKAITINDIIAQNGLTKIDLLKLDIEGSEIKVFESNYKDWLQITNNMLVEIHNWINSDAEKTVLLAVKDNYSIQMAGEYHFFKSKK